MNELTKLQGNATMSSLELVDIINKVRGQEGKAALRHDNFMVRVKEVLGEDALNFQGIYLDSMNRQKPCYHLPKREAHLMVMSENYKVQAAVYDRMVELEGPPKQMTRREMAEYQLKLIIDLEEAEARVESLQITLDENHQWASVKRMEKEHKRSFKWQELKAYSLVNDYEIKRVFDQNYGEVNAYHADVWLAVYGVKV